MRDLDPDVRDEEQDHSERPDHHHDHEREQRLQTVPVGNDAREDESDHRPRVRGGVEEAVPFSALVGPGHVRDERVVRGASDGKRELGRDEQTARDHVARSEDDREEEGERGGLPEEQERLAPAHAVGEPAHPWADQARRQPREGQDGKGHRKGGALDLDQVERKEDDEQPAAVAREERVEGER